MAVAWPLTVRGEQASVPDSLSFVKTESMVRLRLDVAWFGLRSVMVCGIFDGGSKGDGENSVVGESLICCGKLYDNKDSKILSYLLDVGGRKTLGCVIFCFQGG